MNRNATSRSIRKFFAPAFLCAALLLASCGNQPSVGVAQEPPLAGADIGGPFELIDKDGKTVRWSDFAGKYRMVYFGYTYCPDICPTDVQRMMQGQRKFAEQSPELAQKIQGIFITIDPERDTPEVVGQFAAAFSDDLIGLTGSPDQIKQAADNFRVFYAKGQPASGGYLVDHSAIAYLFDPDGKPLATLPTDQGPDAIAAELAKWVN